MPLRGRIWRSVRVVSQEWLYGVKNALSLNDCGHTVDEELTRFEIGRTCRVESLDRLKALEMALPIWGVTGFRVWGATVGPPVSTKLPFASFYLFIKNSNLYSAADLPQDAVSCVV